MHVHENIKSEPEYVVVCVCLCVNVLKEKKEKQNISAGKVRSQYCGNNV